MEWIGTETTRTMSSVVPSALPRIESGTVIGPYVVERRLAKGGLSVLYTAREPDGTLVVLKVLSPSATTGAGRARLIREARALAAIDHPGIVHVRGAGDHEGTPWIAMDFVHGTDLKQVLSERGWLPVPLALDYAAQTTEALAAAHDVGVVHRDLKPSNLLLAPEGRIILIDFGIAKRRTEPSEGDIETGDREVLGTPAYLPPEQLEHGLADERSDIWSLGCVLFEMVVGAPPFGRGGSSTVAAILRDEPVFPTHVPESVRHVITACLRKSSFARVATPRELLAFLRDAIEQTRDDFSDTGERMAPRASSVRPSARPSARSPSGPPPRGSTPPPPVTRGSTPPAVPARPSIPPPSMPPRMKASSRPPSAAERAQARPSGLPRATTMPPPSGSRFAGGVRGRIKGTAVRAVVAWFAEAYGEPALSRVAELASPDLRAYLRVGDPACGVMASGWYETPLVGELLDTLERVASPFDPSEFRSRIAEAVARDNVNGVYRALFRLIATPSLLESNSQRVWQTYVDEGTLTMRLRAPDLVEARIRGWSRHHPSVCRTIRPTIEHVLRGVGYKHPAVTRTHCVAQGDGLCAFEARWQL
jgi:serine/threonine protein kinase